MSMLYGTLAEFCTDKTCEVMSAGSKYEYLWADGVKIKKPVRLSAPDYIDKLFDWVESQVRGGRLSSAVRVRAAPWHAPGVLSRPPWVLCARTPSSGLPARAD